MDEEEITSWSDLELIRKVCHELRQEVAQAHGLIQLVNGTLLDALDAQRKGMLLRIQANIEHIAEVERWMEVWAHARKAQDGER